MIKLIFPALLLVSFSAFAAPKKKVAVQNTIQCDELMISEDNSESDTTGKIVITLDNNGKASTFSYKRKKTANLEALNLQLNATNATITHDVRLNEVESIDEETKEVSYIWGIKDVETVTAKSANGDELTLKINDHSYAGVLGSAVILKSSKATFDNSKDGTWLICKGKIKFP